MKIQKFINLLQFKKKEINIKETPQKIIPTNFLEKEVTNFIQKALFHFVFKYIEKGYELTEKQELIILQSINHPKMISVSQNTDMITHLDVKYQALFLFIDSKEKNLQELLNQQIENQNFQKAVQKYWLSLLDYYKKEKKYLLDTSFSFEHQFSVNINEQWLNILEKYPSIIFHNQTKEETIQIVSTINDLYYYEKNTFCHENLDKFHQIIQEIEKYSLSLLEKNIELDVQKYQGLENKILEKIHQQQITLAIPINIQKILDQLNQLYNEFNQQKLNEEQRFQINNLFDKKIPDTIQKYLSIDPEYRKELKNSQGQNAEAIMLSSLEEIITKLMNLKKQNNENKLQDLTVKQHYFKEMNI